MTFKDFFDELNTLQDERTKIIESIKSHGLPVVLYGAGTVAEWLTERLTSKGCEVAGYAVDDEYFTPNQTYLGRPIYRMTDLILHPNDYVFVLAIGENLNVNRLARFEDEHKITFYAFTVDNLAPIDKEYILNERDKFSETFDMLEDELSRQTMLAWLRTKITGNSSCCAAVYRPGIFFNDLTETTFHGTVGGGFYLDCGSHRGKPIEAFVKWSGGHYKKIIAFEPDPENFAVLENFVRERGYKNVTLLNCGVYDRKGVLSFDSQGNTFSNFSSNGTESIAVEKIDDVVGDEHVSLIGMDIEGSELPALKGAAHTITRDKPALAICAYHRTEDLITLPQYIKSLYGDYKFYLRKHTRSEEYSLLLYAIP